MANCIATLPPVELPRTMTAAQCLLFNEFPHIRGHYIVVENVAVRRLAMLMLYPRIHFNIEKIQLHRAVFQNLVMEGAEVELGAQSFLGFGTDGGNLELADFVGESLSRPCDIAIDLQACA